MTEQWFQAYAEARQAEGLKGAASRVKAAVYFDCMDTPEAAASQDRADADRPLCDAEAM